jgi:hypothetical protein
MAYVLTAGLFRLNIQMVRKHYCLVEGWSRAFRDLILHILCQAVKRNVSTARDLENLVRGAHLCLLRAHGRLVPPGSVTRQRLAERRSRASANRERRFRRELAQIRWRGELIENDSGAAP